MTIKNNTKFSQMISDVVENFPPFEKFILDANIVKLTLKDDPTTIFDNVVMCILGKDKKYSLVSTMQESIVIHISFRLLLIKNIDLVKRESTIENDEIIFKCPHFHRSKMYSCGIKLRYIEDGMFDDETRNLAREADKLLELLQGP